MDLEPIIRVVFLVAAFYGVVKILTWLETTAKETARTRVILSVLHARELAEHAQQLRDLAKSAPEKQRQKLEEWASMIDDDPRLL